MTTIEFITSSRVNGLHDASLYDFILKRVLDDRIIILEKDLDAGQQMELIARGLETVESETGVGINFIPFYVKTQVGGILRNKQQEVQFNLIASGTSKIYEDKKGHYCVETADGEFLSAAL